MFGGWVCLWITSAFGDGLAVQTSAHCVHEHKMVTLCYKNNSKLYSDCGGIGGFLRRTNGV